ncbi:MAG: hypothetical protein HC875_11320 [Anaerolineales bacterium]|nr:hypothetical protein [Anaerolineales bacterium]
MVQTIEPRQPYAFTVDDPPEPFQLLDQAGNLLADTPPLSDEATLKGLRAILLGRRFDELCINLQRRGLMVTFAPGIGQEACTVGSVMALDSSRDWFVPQYREAAGQLLHGSPLVTNFYGTWAAHSAFTFRKACACSPSRPGWPARFLTRWAWPGGRSCKAKRMWRWFTSVRARPRRAISTNR